MSKIPHDLDTLMWTLVESGDLEAIDDFESRFPQFKGELGTRLAMVRGLKGAKPTATPETKPIPKFVARDPSPTLVPRRGVWAVSTLGALAVVALGTWVVVANLPPPSLPPTTKVEQPIEQPNPDEVRDPGTGNMDREPTPVNPANPGATMPNRPVLMPWQLRQSVSISEAPLLDVIKLIAETCSLKVELAPNMPNPNVTIQYANMTGMEMLKDLGRQNKFTPLEQGNGEVLIVPAVPFTDP